jgi:hypothetical protein
MEEKLMRAAFLKVSIAACATVLIGVLAARASQLPDLLGGAKKSGSGVRQPKEVVRWSGLPNWATSLAFSADDKTLAIGLKDRVQLADLETKSLTRSISLKIGQVRSLAYSPDGTLLVAGGYQNVTLLNAATGEPVQELKGHRGYVTGLAFSRDGQRLATACEDEVARIWTLKSDAPPILLKGHSYPVTGIAWSPDESTLATSAGDDTRPTKPGQVRLWDAVSGAFKKQFELHQRAATGVVFSQDGRYLLSSSVDEHINIYDLKNDKALGFFGGHSRPTNAVVVHPDEETAISISGGRAVGKNELMAWEYETGDVVAAVEAHQAKITALALSHRGEFVATGSQDLSVAVWNFGFLAMNVPTSTPGDSAQTATDSVAQEAVASAVAAKEKPGEAKPAILRAGIIGLDTSHAEAFTKTLNKEPPVAEAEGVRVVAAYPKGSPDIKSSVDRVPTYTEKIKDLGVKIVDSIDDLMKEVDVVLLETNDGRPHLEQLLPCLKAGKPTFIDKPIAGTLTDAVAIFDLAKKYQVPVFSSSSLRFGKNSLAVRGGSLGKVTRCETTSPASLEPTHPDLFWYGIHGVESLFTVMGTGCQSVVRGKTAEGKIEVIGQWSGDRIGIFREGSGYLGNAVGEKGEAPVGSYDGYDPLVLEIVKFFKTGQPPVSQEETLEIYAFMEAADESKRQNGASVTLESVMTKARSDAAAKISQLSENK